jgi:hypothetical protein
MKANSEKTKQSKKATRRVLAGVLCGASVLSLVLSLVMPPISQAIANDAQAAPTEETVMGGGSSSESTGVDNTTNGDTENQNSDEVDGGEADSSNGVEQGQSEDQPEGELQVEDGESSDDGAVMAAAEGGQTEAAPVEINSADDLKNKLENASGVASFKLMNDVDTGGTIQLGKDGSKITLDLNGHKIKHESSSQPLFNITGGATLTVMDSQQAEVDDPTGDKYVCSDNTFSKNGNLASVAPDETSNIPTNLTYYVTGSSVNPDGISTTEALYKHEATIGGAIVACNSNDKLKLINLYGTNGKGGTFNLESGVLTQGQGCKVANLVYAENGSTVNMSGGYVCGASTGTSGTGAGIMVSNEKGAASTLNLTGGVIAGNYAPNGGGVYAKGSMVNVDGSIISGNGTFGSQSGYGAGICAFESTVNVTSGYITNNKYQFYQDTDSTNWVHKGGGCHGGGGIAAFNGGSLKINGGYITGNYSAEAGGGIYAGAWKQALSTFTFSGGTIASNVAQNSEGGGIRIAAPTVGVFEVANGSHAYITNNTTNTTNDWGGGGVFVQGGNSDENVNSATLKIYNALITNNSAEGYGGGFAACPTGKTAITDTNGIAIFGNRDENGAHLSGGTNGKNEDQPTTVKGGEITDTFKQNGHKDLFLIRKSDNSDYIAAVTGQMLGGGAANWRGTIDGQPPTTIGKYEGAQAKYMIGLDADPSDGDQGLARDNATLFITGNKSNIHGGGIMTNGDVVAGSTQEVKVYPKMKLNGTKVLTGRTLGTGEFKFQLLKPGKDGKAPSFNDGKLQLNDCSVVDTVENDEKGIFTFDLGEVYADADLVYYLVEVPGTDKDVTYDKTIYKIDPTVVKDERKSHEVLDIRYTYYKVNSVVITTIAANGATSDTTVNPTTVGDVASVELTKSTTFTNAYTKYDSKGSWTPKATKVVEGGEMKKFTLEFADNENFTDDSVKTVSTTAGGDNPQTQDFPTINYTLDSLKQSETDVPGRGASKTFTYYMREKNDSSIFSHYKFDNSVYKFTVVAKDNNNGNISCKVTYMRGTFDGGKWVSAENEGHEFPESTPTFTNTYSTSLPLSGMSGVTLTYLAGAAVLCAAAAWMHIRRKANAKGGGRRE